MRFVFVVVVIMTTTHSIAAADKYIPYEEFIRKVESGNIKSVSLDQFSSINGTIVDGDKTVSFVSFADTGSANDPLLIRLLNDH